MPPKKKPIKVPEVKSDSKGRYVIVAKRKIYIPEDTTESQLIRLIRYILKRRRRRGKKAAKPRSKVAPGGESSGTSGFAAPPPASHPPPQMAVPTEALLSYHSGLQRQLDGAPQRLEYKEEVKQLEPPKTESKRRPAIESPDPVTPQKSGREVAERRIESAKAKRQQASPASLSQVVTLPDGSIAMVDREMVPVARKIIAQAKDADKAKSEMRRIQKVAVRDRAIQHALAKGSDMLKRDMARDIKELPEDKRPKVDFSNWNRAQLFSHLVDNSPEYSKIYQRHLKEVDVPDLQVQTGSGPIGPLDNRQIDKIMERYRPTYLGCIPRDQIGTLSPRPGHKNAFVINMDPAGKPGSHWCAVYADPSSAKASIEWFNPFGFDIPVDIQKDLKDFVEKMEPKTYLKLKVNRIAVQSRASQNCGWFACKFIMDRMRGIPFKECSGYNASKKGEADIEKFKELPQFQYI